MSTLIDNKDLFPAIVAALGNQTDQFADTRQQALASFSQQGLPGRKSEEYRFTPIVRALEKLFPNWPASTSNDVVADLKDYLIEGLDTSVVVISNGRYDAGRSIIKDKEIDITALEDAPASKHPESFLKQSDFTKDPFVAWNTAAWTGGVAIDVTGRASHPLLILSIVDSTATAMVAHARTSVHLAEGSSLSVISRNICTGSNSAFSTMVEEIHVSRNAKLEYCRIQDQKTETSFTQTNIRQLSDSHVNTFTLTLDGNLVRNNLNIAIDGERTESHFHGLYLLNDDTIADNHTVVDHRKPNSVSNEMYKGVMDGNSKAIFNGKIYVRPNAQKTNAFQSNRNILLSDKATINTKPQLEIWADDVKCSHGCTTGQLDEEALFYLRSRGIPKEEARAILLLAFVAETYSFIENETLRSYIAQRVTERLSR